MHHLADRLAASIALLSLVNDKPGEARKTAIGTNNVHADARQNRQISLKHETTITEQLAYVSAYSDSPHHVMAICIEESSEDALAFRVAVNKGAHEHLVEGLRDIAQILENEAKNCMISFCFFYFLLTFAWRLTSQAQAVDQGTWTLS